MGNTFRYDPTSDQYIFNLATKSLSQGDWQIHIDGDGTNGTTGTLYSGPSKMVKISLKK
jgi:hypothetical protein